MQIQALFRAEISLAPALELGDTPQGRRRIIGITGGHFIMCVATGARRAAAVELEVYEVK